MGKTVNAQDNKGTASKDMQGQPAQQASIAKDTTVSLEDSIKPVELRPTVKLVHPRHPDQEYTGDQAWQLMNRGLMYDQAQSERDRYKEHNALLESQLQKLQTDKEARERDDAIRKRMQEMLPNQQSASKRTSESDDSGLSGWLTDGDEDTGQPPQLDMDKLLSGLSAMTEQQQQKALAGFEETINQRLEEMFNKRAEQEQRGKRQTTWLERTREAKIRGLKTQYPNISDSIINEAVELEDAASYDSLKALQLSQEGNDQGAMDIYLNGEEKRQKAAELRQAMIKSQAEYNVQSRNEAELEGLSRGVLPTDADEERLPEYNRFNAEDSANASKSRLERARELIKRQERASGAYPEE